MKLLDSMFSVVGRSDLTFEIAFNENHPIYRAHFPGKPITPGVCIMKLIEELVEISVKREIRLSVAKNVKFLRPIAPSASAYMTICFDLLLEKDALVQARGTITAEGQTCTKFSLIFRKQ
ncbi:MAG: beta-hydroxyacyl-ACP dehydratase [Prevotella sp.]|nr:beta-hydroxyacyl-ACP dehydratase [Prevotella sp.]